MISAIGFSAMMHGYMAFDNSGNLLVPFRTWRNTSTGRAAKQLTELFPIQYSPALEHCPPLSGNPERERHVREVSYLTTLPVTFTGN